MAVVKQGSVQLTDQEWRDSLSKPEIEYIKSIGSSKDRSAWKEQQIAKQNLIEKKKLKEDRGDPYPVRNPNDSLKDYGDEIKDWVVNNPRAATLKRSKGKKASSRKASGGMTKKYGYMGGGKVYGQPRKANYKAG